MYGEFVWWQGIVEDRIDPLKLGRCRVRILGYHTDNKEEGVGIPTADLPWATPSQPITSAAMNGIGTTPLGPIEGTWVFGFFRDGKNAQEPVITGTFGGIPEAGPNPALGFNDPSGKYPLSTFLLEPDTNRLARGAGFNFTKGEVLDDLNGENSPSLDHKRKTRQTKVPVGVAGTMWNYTTDKGTIKNTSNAALYDVAPWNEPNPRYGGATESDTTYLSSVKMSSQYPYNHVRMSESGHVEEWDDTPSAERLHKYHVSGTFEEIQPDGTKVTKIVGNEYEITLGSKDVLINGTCNVTISGDCRMMIGNKEKPSNLVQEVYGDYHLNVHGDMRTKITGNQVTEVLADRKTVINGSDDLLVDKQQIINIKTGNRSINIGGELLETINKAAKITYYSTLMTITHSTNIISSLGNIDIATTTGNIGLAAGGSCNITIAGAFNKKVTGVAKEEYEGVYHERHEGVYKLYVGDDTHTKKEDGKTDYTCTFTRNSSTACETADSV